LAKIIPFPSMKIETQSPELTEQEIQACTLARSLKKLFSDDEIEEIKEELEEDE
jgi:hypothetical protein